MREELVPFRGGAKVSGQVGNKSTSPQNDEDRSSPGIRAAGVEAGDVRLLAGRNIAANRFDHPPCGGRQWVQEAPQLPSPWSEVCKHREGLGLQESEAQLGRGGLMINFRSFSEI